MTTTPNNVTPLPTQGDAQEQTVAPAEGAPKRARVGISRLRQVRDKLTKSIELRNEALEVLGTMTLGVDESASQIVQEVANIGHLFDVDPESETPAVDTAAIDRLDRVINLLDL